MAQSPDSHPVDVATATDDSKFAKEKIVWEPVADFSGVDGVLSWLNVQAKGPGAQQLAVQGFYDRNPSYQDDIRRLKDEFKKRHIDLLT